MPELPEVEVTRRAIAPMLEDRTVVDVAYVPGRVVSCDGDTTFRDALVGATFDRMSRKGKWLRVTTDAAYDLYVHMGLAGNLAVGPRPQERSLAVVHLDDGSMLSYADPKGYGRVVAHDHAKPFERWETLGPDALDDDVTPRMLSEAFARSRRTIKAALTDQSLVAGIGNAYASELLFLAGIRPTRRCSTLSAEEIDALAGNVRPYLSYVTEVIWSQVTNPNGLNAEGISPYLNVYGRDGLECKSCWETIERVMQSGRPSYFCPECQS